MLVVLEYRLLLFALIVSDSSTLGLLLRIWSGQEFVGALAFAEDAIFLPMILFVDIANISLF